MCHRMRAFDCRYDSFCLCNIFKCIYRLIIRNRYILCTTCIMKICMLRSNPRIIQSCRNRINRCNLSIFILAEIGFHTMENPLASYCYSCRRLLRVNSFSCCLAADQSDAFILNKLVKHSHGIASAADTCHNHIRKLSFRLQDLCPRFLADDALEIPYNHRKRVRSHYRTQYIQGIIYPFGPFSHTFIDSIL